MKTLLLLAISLLLFSSCNIAKLCAERYPAGIDTTSDEKDTVIIRDTNVVRFVPTYIPGDSVFVTVPTTLHDTVIRDNSKYLDATVTVKNGKATMKCETDSLQAIISQLTFKLQTIEKIKAKTTIITKTIRETTNHVPRWCWYLLTFTLAYAAYKFYPSYSTLWKKA